MDVVESLRILPISIHARLPPSPSIPFFHLSTFLISLHFLQFYSPIRASSNPFLFTIPLFFIHSLFSIQTPPFFVVFPLSYVSSPQFILHSPSLPFFLLLQCFLFLVIPLPLALHSLKIFPFFLHFSLLFLHPCHSFFPLYPSLVFLQPFFLFIYILLSSLQTFLYTLVHFFVYFFEHFFPLVNFFIYNA